MVVRVFVSRNTWKILKTKTSLAELAKILRKKKSPEPGYSESRLFKASSS